MQRSTLGVLSVIGSAVALFAVCVGTAHAQGVSAEDQQHAADSYDRGTAAYVSRDYGQAAMLFETANRLAPAAAALTQAVRAHGRAGNTMRASTLALQLEALYPNDRAAQRTARAALREARGFLRVNVACEDCRIQVDGQLTSHSSFFVEPDAEHTVVASFETGDVTDSVHGAAGESLDLSFEAPPPPPEPEEPVATEEPDPTIVPPAEGGEPAPSGGSGGVPLFVSIGALVITAGLGAVLVWSGVDALDGVPAYEANPTPDGLADGRSREERTNWLIAGTSVAAAATLVLFLFTDYGGDDGDVQALFDVREDGAVGGLRGRF